MTLNKTKTTNETPAHQLPITILLVEDNVHVAELICLLLQDAGFETRHAITVREALILAVAHPPALFLLDVDLPDGNGFDLCRQLKGHPLTVKIPVIFCTGRADARTEALAVGGVDCVNKPGDVFELPVRVQRALDHHISHPESKSNNVSNPEQTHE
jgi:DNA-binding response OmpR family regulator